MISTFIISSPFGSYLRFKGADSVWGSYTWDPRPGRLGQVMRTVRPVPGGWINAVGLRNSGLAAASVNPRPIYSLAGIESGDWERIANFLRERTGNHVLKIELNLSCPNTREYGITRSELEQFATRTSNFEVIAKLPPTPDVDMLAEICVEAGVEYLHLSNTIPSPIGGISGEALRLVNLPIVERIAARYPKIGIIAGGGIKYINHVHQYRAAGATRFSIATGCLRPWRVRRIIREYGVGMPAAAEPVA